jgi:4-amino-4-deoxy-L-arabinose transferase-like glycosyltransferase
MKSIVERDWFGPLALGTVVTTGAVLRFWNLRAGLPYRIGVDEPVIAEHAIHILQTGDLNPHFFDYPALYIYLQAAVGAVRFLAGAMDGEMRSITQLAPEHLFAWTRAVNAALGTATILVVYRAGRHWGQWTAMLAAAMQAVWINHVRESHFALTDVPLTLMVALSLAATLGALEKNTDGAFVTAGVTVGLAAGIKYNGIIALVMPLAAAAHIQPSDAAWRRAGIVTAAAVMTFLAAAPYTVLDLPGFLNGFASLAFAVGSRAFVSGAAVYLGHLVVGVGWTGVVTMVLGMVWALWRGVRERSVSRAVILLGFPLLYLHVVATKDLIYGRYLLPVTPSLAIVIAFVVVGTATWLFGRPVALWLRACAIAAVLGAVLLPAVSGGLSWPHSYGGPTTQDAAYSLIREFIPPRSHVAVERSVLHLPETMYPSIVVKNLSDRSRDEYLETGIAYVVASSDAFAPVLRAGESGVAAERYRDLFGADSHCLPAVVPSVDVPGPEIRICRLTP